MDSTRKFKGIWIEADVWESKELTLLQKVLLAEIDSLEGESGCFASNQYFADFFGVEKGTIANNISVLSQKGYVNVTHENGANRRIFKTNPLHFKMNPPSRNNEPPLHFKMNPPSRNNDTYNKEYRKIDNRNDSKHLSGKPDSGGAPNGQQSIFGESEVERKKVAPKKESTETALKVLEYMNEVCAKRFDTKAERNIERVMAVLKKGATFDDCRDVLDLKSLQWKGSAKMSQYLQPKTIFAIGNFFDYLEQVKEAKAANRTAAEIAKGVHKKDLSFEGKQVLEHERNENTARMIMDVVNELEQERLNGTY